MFVTIQENLVKNWVSVSIWIQRKIFSHRQWTYFWLWRDEYFQDEWKCFHCKSVHVFAMHVFPVISKVFLLSSSQVLLLSMWKFFGWVQVQMDIRFMMGFLFVSSRTWISLSDCDVWGVSERQWFVWNLYVRFLYNFSRLMFKVNLITGFIYNSVVWKYQITANTN